MQKDNYQNTANPEADPLTIDLDTPLLELPCLTGPPVQWTIRHAVEGVQIFGGIGSGKTSGSGRTLALKYLQAGFGGLVLTAKPDERQLFEQYCREAGRSDDLIIIGPRSDRFFNFLDYEAKQTHDGKGITGNIVEVLKTVIQAGEDEKSGGSRDQFWESALDMLLFNIIDLCQLAYGTVSVEKMYQIVQSLPKPEKPDAKPADENWKTAFERAFELALNKVAIKVRAWESTLSDEMKELCRDRYFFDEEAAKAIPEARLLGYVAQFFKETYGTLSEKTRSIIDFSFSGFLTSLIREPMFRTFCDNPSNVTPEDCLKGKIILIDFPVKVYQKAGRDIQILFKYLFQKSMERRNIRENGRPIFLFADESQLFLHQHDAVYQATARSSRICTVYISQNLPNYFSSIGGGEKAQSKVHSFLGTIGTKIFHSNSCITTNNYGSQLIGDEYAPEESTSQTYSEKFSFGTSSSERLRRIVRPEEFVSLKTGGPLNHHLIQAYIHRQGDPLFDGYNHQLVTFLQNKFSSI